MKNPAPIASKPADDLIPVHGGYRQLKSFQLAQLCFDVTVRFCDRYVHKLDRTHDQMVQAARSGAQNIAEGSKASATSKKIELKLTNVARASLEELRLDYEDYLRQRGLEQWRRQDPRRDELIAKRCTTADAVADWVRELHGRNGQSGPCGPSPRSTHPTRSTPSAKSTPSARSTPSTRPRRPPSPRRPPGPHRPPSPRRPPGPLTENSPQMQPSFSSR